MGDRAPVVPGTARASRGVGQRRPAPVRAGPIAGPCVGCTPHGCRGDEKRRAANTAATIASALPGVPVESTDLLDDRTPVPSPQRRSDYPQRYWERLAATPAFVVGWIVRAALAAPTASWLRLVPANAGLTILNCTADGTDLVAYNDVGHLVALGNKGQNG